MSTLQAPDKLIEQADLGQLMTLPAFRRFMLRLHARAGIMQTTYRADAGASAYAEGRRNLGLELLELICTAVPGAHVQIISEPISSPKESKHGRSHDPRRDLSDEPDA